MKYLSILGSTGSIGQNVLNVVKMFPGKFSIKALAAGNNVELLAKQIKNFAPEIAVVLDEQKAFKLKKILPFDTKVEICYGQEGYKRAASYKSCDMVISAIVGSAGLAPTIAAIEAKKHIGLANKETLVMAGEIVMKMAALNGVKVLPIDSEHSAIFQSMAGQRIQDFSKILLTASGGPFRELQADKFADITLSDALNHPTWQMGKKISIDSATLMNKGLEVIEAVHLFGVSYDDIEVLIHPESIVHSMVSFKDGSVIAQMGIPDMKAAIAYAMSWPNRLCLGQPIPDFAKIGSLNFSKPDINKFPCLSIAYQACKAGHTFPAVMNAANEVAVYAFLNKKISFIKIFDIIAKTMEKHTYATDPCLDDIIDADTWARCYAENLISTSS